MQFSIETVITNLIMHFLIDNSICNLVWEDENTFYNLECFRIECDSVKNKLLKLK